MKKEKHLRLRITEDQLKRLSKTLLKEKKTKSEIVREAIHRYLEENCRMGKTI
jgi:predicted DNA-binding protein